MVGWALPTLQLIVTVDFSTYLEAICNNPKYTQWWETYTVTDVVTIPVLIELRSYKTSVLDLIQNSIAQNKFFVNNNDLETLLKEVFYHGHKFYLIAGHCNQKPVH